MQFQYNPIFLNHIETSSGVKVWFDPNLVAPQKDKTQPDYGKTLKEVLNLSDEDVASVILQAKWEQIRTFRDKELKASDWTQGADVPESIKAPWATYRNALRNLPQDFANPDDVVYPEKP